MTNTHEMAHTSEPVVRLARSRSVRIAYIATGWFFVALGAAGAVLPVVPTTGPLLLALWCFSRGSARLHGWLFQHRVFGPRLQAWQREKVIPRSVKLTAYGSMAASFSYLGLLTRTPWWILAATAAFMLVGVVYISRCPSRSAGDASSR